MKGSPLKEFLLVLLFFGLLSIPLVLLTSRAKPTRIPTAPSGVSQEAISTWMTIRFAHRPESIEILSGKNKVLMLTEFESNTFEQEVSLAIREDQLELRITVKWPEGTPESICEMALAPDGLEEQSAHAWGSETLDEIFSFSWRQP